MICDNRQRHNTSRTNGGLAVTCSFSLTGTGAGIGIALAYTVVPPYFDKKIGMANAIVISGMPLAQMAFAPLLRYLLELYTYRGAVLVYSGILLNGLVGMALFQPVKWHLKPLQRSHHVVLRPLVPQGQDLSSTAAATPEVPHKGSMLEVPSMTPVNRSLQNLQRPMYSSVASMGSAASIDMAIVRTVLTVNEEEPTKTGCTKVLWKTLRRVGSTVQSDMMVIRQLRAIILAVAVMLSQSTSMNFVMMVPFMVRDADFSLQEAAWCVSLVGVTNYVVRLTLSPLVDCKGFSIRCSLMAGYGLKALAMTSRYGLSGHPCFSVMQQWGSGAATIHSLLTQTL